MTHLLSLATMIAPTLRSLTLTEPVEGGQWAPTADAKSGCKATAHQARSSLRHGHQLDDVAVVILVIEATAAIPIVELSVFKAPGPASEGDPSVLDPLQDRVEFGVTYVKRVMLACDSPLRVSEVQGQCVVDAHRRKVTPEPSKRSPKISAKKRAAPSLSRAQTMVWLSVIVMGFLLLGGPAQTLLARCFKGGGPPCQLIEHLP